MSTAPRKSILWVSRVLSGLPSLAMLVSGVTKLLHAAPVVATWGDKFGYPLSALTPIGLVELACVVVYLIPSTAVLGAVLMTGYLGGAIATHVRILDPAAIPPFLFGVFVWAGLYLRDERVRELLPLRRKP